MQGQGATHRLGALVIFVSVLGSSWAYARCASPLPVLAQVPGDVRCAAACAILFFAGREFRDREKLGYWDWEGLLVPWTFTVALALVWAWAAHQYRSAGSYESESGVGVPLVAIPVDFRP